MTKTLGALLDDLAEYPGLPDTACLSLPRDAYTSPELHALEVKEIFDCILNRLYSRIAKFNNLITVRAD